MKIDRIPLPAAEELRALLHYDPKTGVLTWRARPPNSKVNKNFNARFAGKEAGTIESWGYRQLRVHGTLQMAHRVIWKMVKSEEPPDHLDHEDGNPENNRWSNLRSSGSFTNAWNRKPNSNNTSGYPCIYPLDTKRASSKKFRIRMRHGPNNYVEDFHTLEEAKAAYDAAFASLRDVKFKRSPRR
jgi:hypothetical protein